MCGSDAIPTIRSKAPVLSLRVGQSLQATYHAAAHQPVSISHKFPQFPSSRGEGIRAQRFRAF